jgi:tRNA (guanine-N7-)-methyltransferase
MAGFWHAVFDNDHPVEVEVGAGTGTFILPAAERLPAVNFFGIERARSRATRLQDVVDTYRLENARIIPGDAACVVATLIPAESVQAYHVYFPDPWWKRRHHRRRLFTAAFAAALARTLVPGGRIYVATDVDDTFALMHGTLAACLAFREEPGAKRVRPIATAFERKGLQRGATTKEAVFVKRGDAHRFSSTAGQGFETVPQSSS